MLNSNFYLWAINYGTFFKAGFTLTFEKWVEWNLENQFQHMRCNLLAPLKYMQGKLLEAQEPILRMIVKYGKVDIMLATPTSMPMITFGVTWEWFLEMKKIIVWLTLVGLQIGDDWLRNSQSNSSVETTFFNAPEFFLLQFY